MTLMQLVALVPPMCRMAADPQVRRGIEAFSADMSGDPSLLATALRPYPEDARRMMTLLGSGDPPTAESLRRRFSREALAFFHLCGQCAAEELLAVLTRCTVTPTAEAIALLIGDRRREQSAQRYALQLLWRMQGDPSLPDALTLFPEGGVPARSADDVVHAILHRLQEVHE